MSTATATDSLTSRERFQESPEFVLLRPFCTAIVKQPSPENLQRFREALTSSLLSGVDKERKIAAPLVEYILFPFVIHLKIISRFKEQERIEIFQTITEVVSKCEVQCWEMFVELFQRLHLVIGSENDPTKVSQGSEAEMKEVVLSIEALTQKSLSFHLDRIVKDKKMSLLAFSVVLMLQVAGMDNEKRIKVSALKIIENYASTCEDNEEASRLFFTFIPGIVSSLKPMLTLKAGRVYQEVILTGTELLYKAVIVGIRFTEDNNVLDMPDKTLAFVFAELGEEFLLAEDPVYRNLLLKLSNELLKVSNKKLPKVQEVLLNNILVLKSYPAPAPNTKETSPLDDSQNLSMESKEISPACLVSFESIIETAERASGQLRSGLDGDLEISMRKLLTSLSLVRLNFMEFRNLLSLIFALATEIVHSCSTSVVHYEGASKRDRKLLLCKRICVACVRTSSEIDDVLEEFYTQLNNFSGEMNSNFIGCLFTLNEFIQDCLHRKYEKEVGSFHPDEEEIELIPGPYEVLELCSGYITVIDITSSEVVLSAIDAMAPRVQTVVDLRKVYLLEGLGLMTELYPSYCMAQTLYLIVEYAGLQESPSLSETAVQVLERLAKKSGGLHSFFQQNQSFILNELNLRMNNLSMHPNCPNALVYLAKYFDFRQPEFIGLVDDALTRSCDPLSGSYLQSVYAKVFFAFVTSLYLFKTNFDSESEDSKERTSFLSHIKLSNQSLFRKLLEYQKSVGIDLNSDTISSTNADSDPKSEDAENTEPVSEDPERILSSDLKTTLNICQRVLNFLPNSERSVRLISMDCLIKGFWILRFEEDAILPLSHTVWQNIVPRFTESDYVVVRKSFELLLVICDTCGTFLKKRILEEVFPRLSSLILNLAAASENVKNKDRQYYTYTQAFKLQLVILEGLVRLCKAMDVQEKELDEIVQGCMLYLKPRQHKALKEAATKLLNALAEGSHKRSIWMKLVAAKLHKVSVKPPHPLFIPLPLSLNSIP